MDDADTIEPYTGFYRGGNLCTMGAFSYSHSPVVPGMRIGRYCAISWGMKVETVPVFVPQALTGRELMQSSEIAATT